MKYQGQSTKYERKGRVNRSNWLIVTSYNDLMTNA